MADQPDSGGERSFARGRHIAAHGGGGYRIESLLHESASGRLYRAEQVAVGRTVVLKFPSEAVLRDPARVKEFLRRVRAAAKLKYPALVAIHDAHLETIDGRELAFYSREFLPGKSLVDRIRRRGPQSAARALPLLEELARALAYGEAQGFVHGAVHPSHLLFTEDRRLKLLHLGLGPPASPRAPTPAELPFIAPERLDGAPADGRSDVYELAASYVYGLTGELPFGGRREDIEARKRAGRLSADLAAHGVPGAVDQLLRACLEPDAGRRPPGPGALVEEIEARSRPRDAGSARPKTRVAGRPVRASWGWLAIALIPLVAWLAWKAGRPGGGDGRGEPSPALVLPVEPARSEEGETGRSSPDPGPRDEVSEATARALAATLASDTAMEELELTVARWKREETPAVVAREEARDIRRRHPHLAARLDEVLAALEERDGLGRRVGELLGQAKAAHSVGEFRRAIELLDAAPGELAEVGSIAARLEEERARVLEAARAALARLEEESAALARRGSHDAALERIDGARARLPRVLLEDVSQLLDRFTLARESAAKTAEQRRKLEAALRDSLARLDFAAARRVIRESEADAASREQLIEVELAARGWERLLDELPHEVRGAAEWRQARGSLADPTKLRQRAVGRLVAVRPGDPEPQLVLRDSRGARRELPLLDVGRTRLLEILAGDVPGALELVEAVEALGLLRLYARGAARAWPVLVEDPRLPSARRKRWKERLEARSRATLSEVLAVLDFEESGAAAKRRAVERGLEACAALEQLPPALTRLTESYVEARAEELRAKGVAALFAAKVRLKKKILTLEYDFSSVDQLADFVPLGPAKLGIAGGELSLDGEVRLLRGSPFREQLEVRVVASSFVSQAPNVNLALWTREGEEVSYLDRDRRARRSGGASAAAPPAERERVDPKDYLVFGVGYKPDDSDLSPLRIIATKKPVHFPCLAVLGGRRGQGLHRVYRDQPFAAIWAEGLDHRYRKAPLQLRVEHGSRRFRWYVGSARLHEGGIAQSRYRSWLKGQELVGSINLFTNFAPVRFSGLRVEGELDPWWAEAEYERRARSELQGLERRHGITARLEADRKKRTSSGESKDSAVER